MSEKNVVRIVCTNCDGSCVQTNRKHAEGVAIPCPKCGAKGFDMMQLFEHPLPRSDVSDVWIAEVGQLIPYDIWIKAARDYDWVNDPDGLLETS